MLMRLFNDEESIKDSTSKNSVQYRQEQEREKALSGSDQHLARMNLALTEAKKCTPTSTAFCVGGDIISTGYSREHPGNTHAEQVCLDKLQGSVPEGAVLYTTMEPCSERLSGNKPCANRILENGNIRTVYVGVVEPGTFVENTGRAKLEEAGVGYVLVPGLEKECLVVARRGHESADVEMGESSV
jgi:pyrimidine deaminase RibD-like protein